MDANAEALERFAAGDAVVAGFARAADAIAALGVGGKALTHAGPPIPFERMCGPMRAALAGAAVFEGWAANAAAGEALLAAEEVALTPNHHTGAVAPMAGVISPSMSVVVIENPRFGNRAATVLNEGNVPDSLRCGANGPRTIERLRWLNGAVAGELARALPAGFRVRDTMAEALLMGDELHQRNVAATGLLLRAILGGLAVRPSASEAVRYLEGASQCFLNFAMAASKAMLDPLDGIAGSTIVTAMSRNGVDFGIRVSGSGSRWFTAPAPLPRGVYWSGFDERDANPDIGDSAIVETAGAGGFALGCAPAVHAAVGLGGVAAAEELRRQHLRITAGQHPFFFDSPAEGRGLPFGIDVARVAATGIVPSITTGIAHREAGRGQVGCGIVRAPLAAFVEAAAAISAVAV